MESTAASRYVVTTSGSAPLTVTLAQPPGPEQAGRLVVALNGGSRRSGRRFWKAITTDFGSNNRTITTTNFFDSSPGGFVGCDAGCSFNTKSTAATVLVGVNWRPWSGSGAY